MGDSKRSVKNKAKVEESICASDLHRETTYFCSHFFNSFMLSPQSNRNETQFDRQTNELRLSVFKQIGRHGGKTLTHWLTDAESTSAHVHVLINCVEVKPYLE